MPSGVCFAGGFFRADFVAADFLAAGFFAAGFLAVGAAFLTEDLPVDARAAFCLAAGMPRCSLSDHLREMRASCGVPTRQQGEFAHVFFGPTRSCGIRSVTQGLQRTRAAVGELKL